MSAWLSKQNLILLLGVCAVHAGLLWSFNVGRGLPDTSSSAAFGTKTFLVRVVKSTFVNKAADTISGQLELSVSSSADKTLSSPTANSDRKTASSKSPDWPGFQSPAHFLDAQAVDKTADPIDGFEKYLAQRLPLDVESIVLEFWIEKDGSIVLVRCIEGACNEAVQASLEKLGELRFIPATKESASVPSRKVIQIESRPMFGM